MSDASAPGAVPRVEQATAGVAASGIEGNGIEETRVDETGNLETRNRATGVEEELKYRLSAQARAAWPEALALPAGTTLGPGGDWLAEDVYLDTPAWGLLRRGLACRLRMTDGTVKLTLKGLGRVTDGALHCRSEQEATLAADATLSPATWPEGMRDALVVSLGDEGSLRGLRPIAGLSHFRRSWLVVRASKDGAAVVVGVDETDTTKGTHGVDVRETGGGSGAAATQATAAAETSAAPPLAELALDQAWVRAPRRRGRLAGSGQPVTTLSELELERLGADAKTWRALTKALVRRKDLKPVTVSKLERALAAIAAQRPDGLPGAKGLAPEQPLGEAACLALRQQLLAMALTEARVRLERGEDAVHQMRVAARRLGGIIRLFAPALPKAARQGRSWRELKLLRADLGTVRDLDVALLQLDAWSAASAEADEEGPAALRQIWQAARAAALDRLLVRLNHGEHRRLVARLLRWSGMDGGREAVRKNERRTLREAAPSLAAARLEAMLKLAAAFGDRDLTDGAAVPVEELHALRIAGKGLRDGLRPLRGLLSAGGRKALKELEAVVDLLGRLQDTVIADGLAASAMLPAEMAAAYRAGLAAVEVAVRAEIGAVLAPVLAADFGARLHEAWA
ncbi:MAG: CHAD domain-containing protein [Ardenticatenia bacterium]|nr:CHAD domain-containing protein [Ardenticatenia bacterium]